MSTYIVSFQNDIWLNLLRHMGAELQQGKKLEVSFKEYKANRSKAQNAVFHMWAEDVANAIGDDRHGGRLKLQYFVPVLLREDEKWAWLWMQTGNNLSYEKQIALLGEPNVLGCTSRCNTKQFSQALYSLWSGESHLGLRDPETFGLDWRVK